MKLAIRALLAFAALGLAGIAAFFLYFDRVASTAIEAGGRQALGVETRVGWVRIRLLTGEFETGRLTVANPAGFETPYFLQLGQGHFDVSLGSLWEYSSPASDRTVLASTVTLLHHLSHMSGSLLAVATKS